MSKVLLRKVRLIDPLSKYHNKTVDILINNSGGPEPKLITNTKNKDWEKALNINLKSLLPFILMILKEKSFGKLTLLKIV